MKNKIYGMIIIMIISVLGHHISVHAQSGFDRKQFYDIVELTKIIEKARDAGFSEEQISRLELRDGDTTINVKDYLDEIKRRKLLRDKKLKEFLNKNFLTVRDIFKELLVLEPDKLAKLREELVSDR
ncbi:MAG: hypothetical protein GY786_14575 [Proteobacteria bacterium]|nr:hypothetical protein [Pseudomonadota bacterium]